MECPLGSRISSQEDAEVDGCEQGWRECCADKRCNSPTDRDLRDTVALPAPCYWCCLDLSQRADCNQEEKLTVAMLTQRRAPTIVRAVNNGEATFVANMSQKALPNSVQSIDKMNTTGRA